MSLFSDWGRAGCFTFWGINFLCITSICVSRCHPNVRLITTQIRAIEFSIIIVIGYLRLQDFCSKPQTLMNFSFYDMVLECCCTCLVLVTNVFHSCIVVRQITSWHDCRRCVAGRWSKIKIQAALSKFTCLESVLFISLFSISFSPSFSLFLPLLFSLFPNFYQLVSLTPLTTLGVHQST